MAPSAKAPASKATATNGNDKQTKRKLLDDSDSDSEDGGAAVGDSGLKINEDYARRFEYNKNREEKHRCQFPSFLTLLRLQLTPFSGGEK